MTDRSRTPPETLRRAVDIGLTAGLRYVYEGNVPGKGGENTHCPACSALLIERYGYIIIANRIMDGACPDCGEIIPGVGL
jgi:pyruvate formate lyase activating enzyme